MIEVEVEDEAWTQALPDAETLVRRAVEAALAFEVEAPTVSDETIAVLLADDEAVRELNARFRDKDQPTNVLSFPAAESAHPHLGDIALAYGVCAREAEAQGKPLSHHLSHLAVHGTLHLLGYDHQADAEAEAMEAMERAILQTLDISDPYADPDGLGQDGMIRHG
ncbi:rRNA maturation RNase YbeY [Caulobacter sp. S45]|uniref:rRNA maturation RNase YbeY n=1 Tax=Caulobacter sp. S45 TaxID=1641861 RepID=UPI00131B6AEF|nr:rRNA maturation RNase YbeY [Caulobacter sp. S45]